MTSSMMMLDSLVRYMNLMTIDVGDVGVIRWPESAPPIVPRPRGSSPTSPTTPTHEVCTCRDQTLEYQWPLAATTVPSWVSTPSWPDGLPDPEIQKEECRRLIWSSIQLFAGYNSYLVAQGTQVVSFTLCKASNVSSIINAHHRLLLTFLNSSMHSSFPERSRPVHVRETPSGTYTSERWCCGTDALG